MSAFVRVNIRSILKQFNMDIPFLQPIYETIVNSLEAGADKIDIVIEEDPQLLTHKDAVSKKVVGFSITDNGIGFNPENRKSFIEYLSPAKIEFGCKGVGHFTWLKVYEDIQIESYTGNECVKFKFNKDFSEDDIEKDISPSTNSKQTTISFSNITDDYIKYRKRNGQYTTEILHDYRCDADIDKISETISEHLLIKLFLLHTEKHKNFEISIHLNEQVRVIKNDSLPSLKKISFDILNTLGEEPTSQYYTFDLYYNFINDDKNMHKLFYCADGRTVMSFIKDIQYSDLPDNASSIMLLTSKYFNERINNERNQFTFQTSENNPKLTAPIPLPKINEVLKTKIKEILTDKYPSLIEHNNQIIEDCIEEYPYLAKYIRNEESSLIENKSDIVSRANKHFERDKESAKNDFTRMLEKSTIEPDEFKRNIERITDISARELAQYFLYREQIIKALKIIHSENNICEANLHDLFMHRGDSSIASSETFSKYDTNIWLLDDKYMSYTGIFSDKTISEITTRIGDENEQKYGQRKEPDLAIFYNQIKDNLRDVVVVEFKALDVSADRKIEALTEVNRNLKFVLNSLTNVRTAYGYIITKIDDEFSEYIEAQQGVKKLFSNGNTPLYYVYNDNLKDKNNNPVDSHIYFLSSETIYMDADARNKTFIDIIKESN